jgi:hypothetical protein
MAESLFRTFTGISFLQEEANKSIKVALFSGRRTGGALFNLLQVYLWDKFDTQFYPPKHPKENPSGRNLGTSSFWALETLNKLGIVCNIQPSGTHAHELSMALNVLYGDKLDIYEKGFVGTQILGHLLYKQLSAGATMTPMLTDTVGTRSFLETAVQLKDGDKPALCSFATARQDSGTLEEYKNLMEYYARIAGCGKPVLMASEIDERDKDFKKAIEQLYGSSGVGGALGDSEKIDHLLVLGIETWSKPLTTAFGASEAAKITRVWAGNGITGYTVKTGDNAGKDKVTFDKKAAKEVLDELTKRAALFQGLHQAAINELSKSGNITPLKLEESLLAEKQKLLDDTIRRIVAKEGISAVKREFMTPTGETFQTIEEEVKTDGGRRTRRKGRKVTKKYVRKNIKKSKHIRNRRSNRRNSRK